jgi:hypothetical protein
MSQVPSQAAEQPSGSQYQHMLGPDARQFVAPSAFAYWAGTERIMDGELSLAPPRPWLEKSLLPELDDHLSTTAYARYVHSGLVRGRPDWNLVELASLHDITGGAVLGITLRADVRATTAVQAVTTLVVPLPRRLVFVPTLSLGAGSDTTPLGSAAMAFRLDDTAMRDYSVGVEVSDWTYDRWRVLGKLGTLHRLSTVFAIEGYLGVGAWAGPVVGGDAALQVILAALQTLSPRFDLYERATFARGAAYQTGTAPPVNSAYSVDVAAGVRWKGSKSYGFTLAADGGGQLSYKRWGLELTAYGMLF